MEVTLRLFAVLRERAGAPEVTLELPEGARVRDAVERVGTLVEDVPVVMAVNREYAGDDRPLAPGDELALIPPVSGGGGARQPTSAAALHADGPLQRTDTWARVTGDPLSPEAVAARVRDPRAGAVVTFQGVTRQVERLEYEAYAEMAEERLREIALQALRRHGLCAAAVEHRVGAVPLSEPSVVVAVSAAHRDEAFAGAREIIDRVKAEAPIWKKEVHGDGERWVQGVQPRSR